MSRLPAVISPSLLSADFGDLGAECRKMLSMGADTLHVDIMDGHFVPNLSFGMPAVKASKKHTESFEYKVVDALSGLEEARRGAFLDCHLMVTDPKAWLSVLHSIGVHGFTFHYEAMTDEAAVTALLLEARALGLKAGVAIKPKTEASVISPSVAAAADMVLVMTVEPGFGGQKFMADMMPKVRWLRAQYPTLDIQVDGGIDSNTISIVAEAGANVIVSGSGVFNAEDPQATMALMRKIVDSSVNKQ